MARAYEKEARSEKNNLDSNKDNCALNNLKQDSLSDKVESMDSITSPLSFPSTKNPKVNITLEFDNTDGSQKAEMEIIDMLKGILLEKYKNRGFQTVGSALGCSPLNN